MGCRLIFGVKEWNWCVQADLHFTKKEKKKKDSSNLPPCQAYLSLARKKHNCQENESLMCLLFYVFFFPTPILQYKMSAVEDYWNIFIIVLWLKRVSFSCFLYQSDCNLVEKSDSFLAHFTEHIHFSVPVKNAPTIPGGQLGMLQSIFVCYHLPCCDDPVWLTGH